VLVLNDGPLGPSTVRPATRRMACRRRPRRGGRRTSPGRVVRSLAPAERRSGRVLSGTRCRSSPAANQRTASGARVWLGDWASSPAGCCKSAAHRRIGRLIARTRWPRRGRDIQWDRVTDAVRAAEERANQAKVYCGSGIAEAAAVIAHAYFYHRW